MLVKMLLHVQLLSGVNTFSEKVSELWHLRNGLRRYVDCHFCSHLSVPNVPKLPGLESYQGIVAHSHNYRHPENYQDKRVLVLGAAASGQDIAVELSGYCKQVGGGFTPCRHLWPSSRREHTVI